MKKENKKQERFGLSVSFSKRENDMVDRLRKAPHYTNMSEFIRECIRNLYKEKFENEK